MKCNGQLPCQRCLRSDITCLYDVPQQKKETPKPTTESHEPRLKRITDSMRHYKQLTRPKTTLPPPPPPIARQLKSKPPSCVYKIISCSCMSL